MTQNSDSIPFKLINALCEMEMKYQEEMKTQMHPTKIPRSDNVGPLRFINEMIQLSVSRHAFPDNKSEKEFYSKLDKRRRDFINRYFEHLKRHKVDAKMVRDFFKTNAIEAVDIPTHLKSSMLSCRLTEEQVNRLFHEIKE